MTMPTGVKKATDGKRSSILSKPATAPSRDDRIARELLIEIRGKGQALSKRVDRLLKQFG